MKRSLRVYWFASLLVSGAILVSCRPAALNVPEGTKKVMLESPNDQTIEVAVEIADEAPERSQGLMHRPSLEENAGMLFVFDDDVIRSFWMKNTLIPLDILFFDSEGGFVSALTMEPCSSDPCPSYLSEKPARFALEVNAGFVLQNWMGEGWELVVD